MHLCTHTHLYKARAHHLRSLVQLWPAPWTWWWRTLTAGGWGARVLAGGLASMQGSSTLGLAFSMASGACGCFLSWEPGLFTYLLLSDLDGPTCYQWFCWLNHPRLMSEFYCTWSQLAQLPGSLALQGSKTPMLCFLLKPKILERGWCNPEVCDTSPLNNYLCCPCFPSTYEH